MTSKIVSGFWHGLDDVSVAIGVKNGNAVQKQRDREQLNQSKAIIRQESRRLDNFRIKYGKQHMPRTLKQITEEAAMVRKRPWMRQQCGKNVLSLAAEYRRMVVLERHLNTLMAMQQSNLLRVEQIALVKKTGEILDRVNSTMSDTNALQRMSAPGLVAISQHYSETAMKADVIQEFTEDILEQAVADSMEMDPTKDAEEERKAFADAFKKADEAILKATGGEFDASPTTQESVSLPNAPSSIEPAAQSVPAEAVQDDFDAELGGLQGRLNDLKE